MKKVILFGMMNIIMLMGLWSLSYASLSALENETNGTNGVTCDVFFLHGDNVGRRSLDGLEEEKKNKKEGGKEEELKEIPLSCLNSPDGYYRQSLYYESLGRYRDAHKMLEEALKLDSNHKLAQEKYALMNVRIQDAHNSKSPWRKAFLESIGFDTPTDYIYLVMSSLAYQNGDSLRLCMNPNLRSKPNQYVWIFFYLGHQNLEGMEPHCDILFQNGWELGLTNEDVDIEGNSYFGVSFVHPLTKRVIVAHRGTNDIRDVISDLSIIKSVLPIQYERARLFTEKVAMRYVGFSISHAGHSLGAVLAELLAHNRNELAVTADSLGIKGILNTLKSENKDPLILCYVSAPNLVNTYTKHMGRMRSVIPTYPKTSSWNYAVDYVWNLIKEQKRKLFFTQLLQDDLSSHHIASILGGFDPNSQLLSQYYNVKQWPSSSTQRLALKTLCDTFGLPSENPYSPDPALQERLKLLDYVVEPVNPSRMPLRSFSKPVQIMLRYWNSRPNRYPNSTFYSPRIWRLHSIQDDQVVIQSDPNLFTAEDFRSYIEHKYIEELKYSQCCKVPISDEKNEELLSFPESCVCWK